MLDTAVILCAGRGTRLYPVTLDRPKAAINVAGKPVVARIAEDLVSAGIRRAVVVVSPTDNTTAGLLKARGPRNLEVTAVVQDEPLGLAHAVQCARKSVGDSSFLLYLGDELIYPGTSTFLDAAARAGGDGAILLKAVDEPEHFGVAILNGHRVVRLQEKPKPAPSNLAVVGLYILPPAIFDAIEQTPPSARGEVEITDAIQRLIDEGAHIVGVQHDGVWFDVGRVEVLLAANRFCLEREVPQWTGPEQPTVDVRGNVSIGSGCSIVRTEIRGPVLIAENCRIEDSVIGPGVVLGTGCEVTGSAVSDSIVGDNCHITGLPGGLRRSVLADEVSIDGGCCRLPISLVAGRRTCLSINGGR